MVSKLEEGGLRHFNVWESADEWARFNQERVRPALSKVLSSMGINGAPEEPTLRQMTLVDLDTR